MQRSIEMLEKAISEEFDGYIRSMIWNASSVDECVEKVEELYDVVRDMLEAYDRGDFAVYDEAGDETRN